MLEVSTVMSCVKKCKGKKRNKAVEKDQSTEKKITCSKGYLHIPGIKGV
jgi:hypothetical protein